MPKNTEKRMSRALEGRNCSGKIYIQKSAKAEDPYRGTDYHDT
jgi:hypothetical protein